MVIILDGIEKSLSNGENTYNSTNRLQAMVDYRQQLLQTLKNRIGKSTQ